MQRLLVDDEEVTASPKRSLYRQSRSRKFFHPSVDVRSDLISPVRSSTYRDLIIANIVLLLLSATLFSASVFVHLRSKQTNPLQQISFSRKWTVFSSSTEDCSY
jgi:hypothetical protein